MDGGGRMMMMAMKTPGPPIKGRKGEGSERGGEKPGCSVSAPGSAAAISAVAPAPAPRKPHRPGAAASTWMSLTVSICKQHVC